MWLAVSSKVLELRSTLEMTFAGVRWLGRDVFDGNPPRPQNHLPALSALRSLSEHATLVRLAAAAVDVAALPLHGLPYAFHSPDRF
jgi:hypothetical protein